MTLRGESWRCYVEWRLPLPKLRGGVFQAVRRATCEEEVPLELAGLSMVREEGLSGLRKKKLLRLPGRQGAADCRQWAAGGHQGVVKGPPAIVKVS